MKKKLLLLSAIFAFSGFAVACEDEEPAHEHSYAPAWSSNETMHWHAADCDHTDMKADETSHVDADKDGDCDVCAYEGLSVKAYVNEALTTAKGKANTVNEVTGVTYFSYSSPVYVKQTIGAEASELRISETAFSEDKSSTSDEDVIVLTALGTEGDTLGMYQTTVVGEDDVVTYEYNERYGSQGFTYYVTPGAHTGIATDLSDFQVADTETVGMEAFVEAFYNLTAENAASFAVDGNVYTLTVDYVDVDEVYYVSTTVTFTLSETGLMEKASATADVYYTDANATKASDTAPWVLNELAVPEYSVYYVFTQKAGDKTYVAPEGSTAEDILATDFNLIDENDATVDTSAAIDMLVGTQYNYTFDIDTDLESISFVADEEEVSVDFGEVFAGYDNDYNAIYKTQLMITPNVPGEIEVTVNTDLISKTIKLNATRPTIEGLYIKDASNKTTDYATGFTGIDYTFSAVPTNKGAEPEYTAAFASETTGATLTQNENGSYTFNATVAGTYVVNFTSAAKDANGEDVVKSLMLSISELPDVSEIIDKDKTYVDDYGMQLVFNYTDDWKSGTATVTNVEYQDAYGDYVMATVVLNYTYDETTNTLTTTIDEANSTAAYFEQVTNWSGYTQVTDFTLGFDAEMALEIIITTHYYEDWSMYGGPINEYDMPSASTLHEASIYDTIAVAWAGSINVEDENETMEGYNYNDPASDWYATIKFNADQTGQLQYYSPNKAAKCFVTFNYTVEKQQDGTYTVTFSSIGVNERVNAVDETCPWTTASGSTVTAIATTVISADLTTVTVGSTAFTLNN